MKRLLVCLAMAAAALVCAAEDRVDLKAGDKAPSVKLKATDDKEYSLEQFAGKSSVALVWFLRAGSGGSKAQLSGIQARLDEISKYNVHVLGITTSPLKECQDFAKELKLTFPLLSDTDQAVAKAYGALRGGTGPMCERWVFLIDDQGVIKNIEKGEAVADKGKLLIEAVSGKPAPDAPAATTTKVDLKPGDKAPALKLKGTDDKDYTLDQFAGKSSVALVWFLRAGSGGSKAQLAGIQAEMDVIREYNVEVFGITTSPLKECQDFAKELKLTFPLLSDTDQAVAQAYGTLRGGTGPGCERWVFLIDDKGVIRNIEKSQVAADKGKLLVQALEDKRINGK
ncbi:MAG: redoxin domain-containing protein [Armatimonadetes bacterium]|nr:redoxin domain-containing protein [Armatimonadota bacterium]